MTTALHLGRWQTALADIAADCLIADPPYSARTHAGAKGTAAGDGVSLYAHWTPDDAVEFARSWHPRIRDWIVILSDDRLGPVFRDELEALGRQVFPLVPILQHMPRITGDGPGSPGCFAVVARPRNKRMASWGSLPCWYESSRDAVLHGGKPLPLMRAIVRDYAVRGGSESVVDPCAGAGTTLLAAREYGLAAIGAEVDPSTYAIASGAIASPHHRDLFSALDG